MIVRRFGGTVGAVAPDFHATAFNELQFVRRPGFSLPWEEFEASYERTGGVALDAETEHALFERYTASARAVAAATGGIAVFVSHRFSTVRMADRIVVLDDGRVAEQGTHDQLVAAGGLYADLFSIQAAAYAD